jgi:hypothetical protein
MILLRVITFFCVKHVFQFTLKTILAYLCTRPFVYAMLDIYTNNITLFLDVTTTKWGEKHMFHTRGTTSSQKTTPKTLSKLNSTLTPTLDYTTMGNGATLLFT